MSAPITSIAVLFALIVTVYGAANTVKPPTLKCYECNVWKAGYGHLCENPRIRDECTVCMKTETTVFMGYYKNTPRFSTTISRVCGKTKTVHFGHECHHYTMADGHSWHCYCDDDLCNGGPPVVRAAALSSVLTVCGMTVVLQRLLGYASLFLR